MKMNKILILGATGRTGKQLVPLPLSKGYSLRCLVRYPEKIRQVDDRLEVLQGDPIHVEQLSMAMQGVDVVISLLNISRKNDFPWSPLRTPTHYLSEVMANVLAVCKEQAVNRLVVCSAWGVADTQADIPGWFRWMIKNSNIGVAYEDHERQEQLIKATDLDWTIVRPVGLTNSGRTQKVITSYSNTPQPKLTISRKSVAAFMLDAVNQPDLVGKAPTISA